MHSWHGRAQQWELSTAQHLRELNAGQEHTRNDGAMAVCALGGDQGGVVTGNSVGDGAMLCVGTVIGARL